MIVSPAPISTRSDGCRGLAALPLFSATTRTVRSSQTETRVAPCEFSMLTLPFGLNAKVSTRTDEPWALRPGAIASIESTSGIKRLARAALQQIRLRVRCVVGAELFMTLPPLNSNWEDNPAAYFTRVWYCDKTYLILRLSYV